jgi:3-hydroxyisobutyrate dehydrogenase-like beta-hydroxyacid dehydrogenase
MIRNLAFIGFGEAGQYMTEGLIREAGAELAVWDILFDDEAKGPALLEKAKAIGARPATSAADAMAGAEIVFSGVTTDKSLVAANQCAPNLPDGAIYLDLNSTSPGKKRQVADAIEAAGGHMVEAAVMDMVPPHAHKVPLLLAGPKASEAAKAITRLGMRAEALDGGIGTASTVKMCRSVFMKGLSAIMLECAMAADKAGITDEIIDSIGKTYPGLDWTQTFARTLKGTSIHAGRRAGEMQEVASTLEELGITPMMSLATSARLQDAADSGLRAIAENNPPNSLEDVLANVRAAQSQLTKAAE